MIDTHPPGGAPSTTTPPTSDRGFLRNTRALVVAGIVVGLALVGVVALSLGGDDSDSGELTAEQVKDGKPVIASAEELRSFAASVGHPVFWAGEVSDLRFELTFAAEKAWVRYLPKDVEAGDKRRTFLTVGTYPQPHPFADLEKASKKPGTVSEIVPGGGRLLYYRKNARSVYLAYPATDYLVEVYSPSAPEALRLVQTGAVGQIR